MQLEPKLKGAWRRNRHVGNLDHEIHCPSLGKLNHERFGLALATPAKMIYTLAS